MSKEIENIVIAQVDAVGVTLEDGTIIIEQRDQMQDESHYVTIPVQHIGFLIAKLQELQVSHSLLKDKSQDFQVTTKS